MTGDHRGDRATAEQRGAGRDDRNDDVRFRFVHLQAALAVFPLAHPLRAGARGQAERDTRAVVVERLNAAMNAHDIDAFVACFDEDYESEQPAHPDRAFRGREQVRQNWSAIFASVKDFRSELVRADAAGGVEWSEWRWRGTHDDGTLLDMAGVIVGGVRDDRLIWARLYVEPVEQGGAGIDAAVREMAGDD
jgi:ketosteroid isomerase-like protein